MKPFWRRDRLDMVELLEQYRKDKREVGLLYAAQHCLETMERYGPPWDAPGAEDVYREVQENVRVFTGNPWGRVPQ